MMEPMLDAVITGAGRGLGRAVAMALAADGAAVWICSDNLPELETTASLIERDGGRVHVSETDLSDPESCRSFCDSVANGARNLRVVVNNAAVLKTTPVLEMPLEHWSNTLAVMLTAPFLVTRDLLPLLLRNGGSIISVSSRSAVEPFVGEAAYCAAKFGVEALTKCLALELDDCAVSVNTITPGLRIKPTSITDEQAEQLSAKERAAWNDPMEIMPAFLFLAELRGQVTGRRFDALELTKAIRARGKDGTLATISELYR